MNLSQNRFTLATLVIMLGVTAALVAVGFTVTSSPRKPHLAKPIYTASTVGTSAGI